jgi:hypothetical protein
MTASDATNQHAFQEALPEPVAIDDQLVAEKSRVRFLLRMLSLRYVLSYANPYPVVIKQFLQFCLILTYPAWIVGVLVSLGCYLALYSVLWVIFWPVRAWMKRNRPDEYAQSQQK